MVSKLEQFYQAESARFLGELQQLLNFPSVSTEPRHHSDCLGCADWIKQHFLDLGFQAELLTTVQNPCVFAEYHVSDAAPTVLIYGHYDLQPIGSRDDWESDPFTATVINERLYARGARDNKGQTFFYIKAAEALIKLGLLSCNLKFLIEGQEEAGSAATRSELPNWLPKLQADYLLSSETRGLNDGRPAICLGYRGFTHFEITLTTGKNDLHSGNHGGVVKNAALELSRLISSLHNSDGTVAAPGFYDGVILATLDEQKLIKENLSDVEQYYQDMGIYFQPTKNSDSLAERIGFHPSLDCCGMQSGYNGVGVRTIIPHWAQAKIVARLAVGQDPSKVGKLLIDYLQAQENNFHLEFSANNNFCSAFRINPTSPQVLKAKKVLEELDLQPGVIWIGATIPLLGQLTELLQAEAIFVGFGQSIDNEHGANESFSLGQFKKGFLFAGSIFQELAVNSTAA